MDVVRKFRGRAPVAINSCLRGRHEFPYERIDHQQRANGIIHGLIKLLETRRESAAINQTRAVTRITYSTGQPRFVFRWHSTCIAPRTNYRREVFDALHPDATKVAVPCPRLLLAQSRQRNFEGGQAERWPAAGFRDILRTLASSFSPDEIPSKFKRKRRRRGGRVVSWSRSSHFGRTRILSTQSRGPATRRHIRRFILAPEPPTAPPSLFVPAPRTPSSATASISPV